MANTQPTRPIADRVSANLRDLRKARGLSLADVSERMNKLGRPLSLSGLSKVERGDRGVDVDDLVALALALDVTPSRLLLTATADEDKVALTPNLGAATRTAWEWACGEAPTYDPATDEDVFDLDRVRRFGRENRPHDPPDDTPAGELLQHQQELQGLVLAILRLQRKGLSRRSIHDAVEMMIPLALAAYETEKGH